MSNVQVLEYILKWSLIQHPELSLDPFNYSKNDFNTLKITLQSCILFIRFYNFTHKEFLNKVVPYKKNLFKKLYKELFTYFLDLNIKLSDTVCQNLKNL